MALRRIAKELVDVQALPAGELPHVAYCGPPEGTPSGRVVFHWTLRLRGCASGRRDWSATGGPQHDVRAQVVPPPSSAAESAATPTPSGSMASVTSKVSSHSRHAGPSIFFGVMIHLEIGFPPDYPFNGPRITYSRSWLARVNAVLEARPAAVLQKRLSSLRQEETSQRWQLKIRWLATFPEGREAGGAYSPAASRVSGAALLSLAVVTMTGLSTPPVVGLRPDAPVRQVKLLIAAQSPHIPVDHQRLMFSGRLLDDDQSLEGCGIASGDTIHLGIVDSASVPLSLGGPSIEWTPAWSIPRMLKQLHESTTSSLVQLNAFDDATGRPVPSDSRLIPLRDVIMTCHSDGEVQWLLRAAWPQPDVIWSPEHFGAWPLHFRRCIRYLRRVTVRDGRGRLCPLPYDILNEIAAFL